MKKILIFSGTTEGRELAEQLAARGISCTVCVATEYGEQVMRTVDNLQMHTGRMTEADMLQLLEEEDYLAVVDATHPHAALVSENIRRSARQRGIVCLRLARKTDSAKQRASEEEGVFFVKSHDACAALLHRFSGNILLTTGSRDLAVYTADEKIKSRLYIRVLPSVESIQSCERQKISGKQIIAMQGPFSQKLNEAIIFQYKIGVLVTKESGKNGGFPEKLKAARSAEIPVIVIENPECADLQQTSDGYCRMSTVDEVFAQICQMAGIRPERSRITLVGIGMGNPALWTREAHRAICSADYLFGAKRMLQAVSPQMNPDAVRIPYYRAREVLTCLREHKKDIRGKRIVLLFSGDIGFYSGAGEMYRQLEEAVANGELAADIDSCTGISSVSYLSAKTHISWHDAKILSIHGRKANVLQAIGTSEKLFLLMSGLQDVRELGQLLLAHHLYQVRVTVGYQLSCQDERIKQLTAEECIRLSQEGLYTCIVENPAAAGRMLTPGISDSAFLRGSVPMTKEEVRDISICRLRLHRNAVFYDIGSGTGSIAVEAAALSDEISVYAIERKEEALALIRENCANFGLSNVTVVAGEAPEALWELPVPTHAFIGGSGGRLHEIVALLYRKNPRMRLVINAISLETVGEITGLCHAFPMEQEELVQLQASRSKKAGDYHLMQGGNPVFVFSCTFAGKEAE